MAYPSVLWYSEAGSRFSVCEKWSEYVCALQQLLYLYELSQIEQKKKQPLEGLELCIFGLNYVRLLPQECQLEGVQFFWL